MSQEQNDSLSINIRSLTQCVCLRNPASACATQVRAVVGFVDIKSVLVVVCKALTDELSTPIRYLRLLRECNLTCIEDSLVPDDGHLRFVVPKRFDPEKQLVKNHADAPYINLNKLVSLQFNLPSK